MDYSKELLEWTIHFVKNKDLLHKKILNHKINGDEIIFEFKDKKHVYKIEPDFNQIPKGDGFMTISTLNKRSNIEFLYKNWEELKKNPKLSVLFVNLKNHEKFMLTPKTHDLITEKASLKLGLLTMMETTGEVS